MGPESSEQRKRITRAISAGDTHLEKSALGWDSRLAGVSMTLGRIAFARMPSSRYSASSERTSASTAAFEIAYAAPPLKGSSAARAPTHTIAPPPESIRAGSAAREELAAVL